LTIDVRDRPDDRQYEVTVDGQVAGKLVYRLGPDQIAFTHAEVDSAYGGKGVGSALASHALDDARARGLAVLPDCPFVTAYVKKHSEYVDLVPDHLRPSYGLD